MYPEKIKTKIMYVISLIQRLTPVLLVGLGSYTLVHDAMSHIVVDGYEVST